MPDELWNEVCDIVQETGIKTMPKKKKWKKEKWLSGEALQRPYRAKGRPFPYKAKGLSGDGFQIVVKRREAKSKREKRDTPI